MIHFYCLNYKRLSKAFPFLLKRSCTVDHRVTFWYKTRLFLVGNFTLRILSIVLTDVVSRPESSQIRLILSPRFFWPVEAIDYIGNEVLLCSRLCNSLLVLMDHDIPFSSTLKMWTLCWYTSDLTSANNLPLNTNSNNHISYYWANLLCIENLHEKQLYEHFENALPHLLSAFRTKCGCLRVLTNIVRRSKRAINALRPSDAYIRQQINHHWFR